jgi:hypothetical protein
MIIIIITIIIGAGGFHPVAAGYKIGASIQGLYLGFRIFLRFVLWLFSFFFMDS